MAALVGGGMLAGTVSTASAATLTYSTTGPYVGSVTGILGLSVGDKLYNVGFVYGSYDAVYPEALTFANATAIIDAINVELGRWWTHTKSVMRPDVVVLPEPNRGIGKAK
jgi:hypothetical protein